MVKIEVAKSDLEATLSVVGLTVSSGADLSAHYVFRTTTVGGVEVLSYDMRTFSLSPLKCRVTGDGSFTLEGWRLTKWLSGVRDGLITITTGAAGEVTVQAAKSKSRFRSLDPKKFPYWDKTVAQAKVAGSVQPGILLRALNYAKKFISADDTNRPELCQIEVIDGVLWSSDRKALSSVSVPAMPDLNLRIPGKDVSSVVKFLSLKDTQSSAVEVRIAERPTEEGGGASALFCRPDGSYLGVSKPQTAFPTLNLDREAESEASFDMDMEDFKLAINTLAASAPKNHAHIKFKYDGERVLVSMPSEAGEEDAYPLTLRGDVDNGVSFETGFEIEHAYLTGIAESFGLPTLKVGVTRKGKGGFVSVRHTDTTEQGANDYFSVVVWKT